jgi:hypothetical protein
MSGASEERTPAVMRNAISHVVCELSYRVIGQAERETLWVERAGKRIRILLS